MRWGALLGAVVALLIPAGATAKIKAAGSVLPPGQSGFVSTPGVADGTGSPHLNDQTPLFVKFQFKPAMLGMAGGPQGPKQGVRVLRDDYGVPSITGTTLPDTWGGARF